MEKAKENDCMIVAHTEDMSYRRPGACVHDSEVVTSKGWLGIPSACESAQLIRDLEITKEVGNAYHAGSVYAKDITLNINGTSYTFDSNGYMK